MRPVIKPKEVFALVIAMAAFAISSISAPSVAIEAGDFLIRVRAIGIVPDADSGNISGLPVPSGLDAQYAVVPEIDFTYMITDHIGAELIAAISYHDLDTTGVIAGIGRGATTWLLPPTLLLQYHFLPQAKIRPYVGVGLNVTIPFGENADSSLEAVLGPTEVDIDPSVSYALQAGVDVEITDRLFLNLDFKYIDIDVDAHLRSGGVTRSVDVAIDPFVAGLGIGFRF